MKARTLIQKAVEHLQYNLTPLSYEEEKEARERIFLNYCYKNKSTAHCLECGNAIDLLYIGKKKTITCPHCTKKLKVETTLRRTLDDEGYYFAKAEVVEYDKYSFQVIRNFYAAKHCSKGEKSRIVIYEVCQNWYDSNSKKRTIYSRLEQWHGFQGSLEIRKEGYYNKYDPFPTIYLKSSVFKPEYKKYGLSYKMSFLRFSSIRYKSLNCSKTETLLKAGYFDVIYKFGDNIHQYWNALKIMIRNKYRPKNTDIYYDYLVMLSELKKDLNNSFYVCPKNLQKAHDNVLHVIEKKRAKERAETDRKKLEAELLKNKNAIRDFINSKQKYFGLKFSNKRIDIEVLSSIEDFIKESNIMNHCVFNGKYFNREHSLVLRSFVNKRPAETIEVCLKEFKILQSRGRFNRATEHHKSIIQLMNKHLITIKKIALNEQQLKTA